VLPAIAGAALLCGMMLAGAGAGQAQTATAPTGAPGTPAPGESTRGSPEAVPGGTFRENQKQQPQVLHPFNATDLYGNQVLDLIYETLAQVDVDSLRHLPLLAERWEISRDKKTFTFHLDPRATWQDGQPVTAEDVKFSYDALFHPKLRTRAKWQAYFGQFTGATVVDARTVRFTARQDHYLNFVNLAGLRIVPRHAYGTGDPNATPLAKQPLGSGPYRFQAWNRGQSIVLKRDEAYWGRTLPQNRGRYNSGRLLFRFIPAEKVALESFKKGDLDLIELTPEQWFRESPAPEFTLAQASGGPGPGPGQRLFKLEVKNQAPRRYRYVGWNLESPMFRDKRVRRALGLLFDRDTFAQKFYYGAQVKAVGPFEAGSRYTSPNVKPLGFSVPEAIQLFKAAGWADTDGDGVLDRDGVALRFTVLTADPEVSVKILTLAQSAMRQAGVELNIKVVDWSTLLSLIDEYKFDAILLGWTREPWPDPAPLWHSRSAVRGGLNLVRYRNPEADKLIDAGDRSIPDEQRVKLFRRLHEILAEDQPYTFLMEEDRSLFAYQSTLRQARPYYALALGEDYWWFAQAVR
jgi:peptide/nickel transport system substrate-binding protein/microcin C transport system substrate-binding protein